MSLENTIIEEFKKNLDSNLSKVQTELMFHDGFYPLFVYTTATGVDEVEIDFEETSKDVSASIMREHCKNPTVVAAALIFCAYTVEQDLTDPKEKHRVLSEDIQDEEDATEAIFMYLYTRDRSEVRRVNYTKKDQGAAGINDYRFLDDGWNTAVNLTGLFSNPFMPPTV